MPCDALLHYRPSLCVPSSSPQHQYLTEALHWRAQTDADHVLFVLLNAKVIIILVIPCLLRKKKAMPFHLTVTNRCSPPPLAAAVLQGVAVSTATCVQLHKRAEKIAAALTEKGSINTGENVVLLYPPGGLCLSPSNCPRNLRRSSPLYFKHDLCACLPPPGIDLVAAFYGCLYVGCVPVNVRPPHPQNLAATLPTVRMIIDVSSRHCQGYNYCVWHV